MSDGENTKLVQLDDERGLRRLRRFVRENPYSVAIVVVATLGGAVFGALVPMGELSLLRRTLGGAVAGFYFGLFPLGFRLLD